MPSTRQPRSSFQRAAPRLNDLLSRFRRLLANNDQELVLLFEDIAIARGLQLDLVDALTTPGRRPGKPDLCVLRVALAVTKTYWEEAPETLSTRAYAWQSEMFDMDLPADEAARRAPEPRWPVLQRGTDRQGGPAQPAAGEFGAGGRKCLRRVPPARSVPRDLRRNGPRARALPVDRIRHPPTRRASRPPHAPAPRPQRGRRADTPAVGELGLQPGHPVGTKNARRGCWLFAAAGAGRLRSEILRHPRRVSVAARFAVASFRLLLPGRNTWMG